LGYYALAGLQLVPTSAGDDMSEPKPGSTERETDRIEAFSDGVFAIAITLLILDIPDHDFGRFRTVSTRARG
jgi:hypothetical protein